MMRTLNKLFEAYEARKAIEHEATTAEKREAADRMAFASTLLREIIVPALRKTARDINGRARGAEMQAKVGNVSELHAAFTLLNSHLTFEIQPDAVTAIKWIITDNTMNEPNRYVERAPIYGGTSEHFKIDDEIVAFVEAVLSVN